MLERFIVSTRETIIVRARARVASRTALLPTEAELANGIPAFLDQLGAALILAKSSDVVDHADLAKSAGLHGRSLLRMGFTVAQVVLDYGDICQAITELAIERGTPISPGEFRTLNLCLDDAIAEAVTGYGRARERVLQKEGTERLGFLAHELRNQLNTAMLAFESIKSGRVSANGSTGQILDRSLGGLRDLIDRSLADVRLDAGIQHMERIPAPEFIEEVSISALIQAQKSGIHFSVSPVDPLVIIEGDRQILAAAIANLLQNAFKFSHKHGHVSLLTTATEDRVLFEVADECGGLPPGKAEDLFRPFEQRGKDLSGIGLGLSICRKAAAANGGEIRVRDIPGKGCVFTLDLPRKLPPTLTVVSGGKGGTRPSRPPERANTERSDSTLALAGAR